MLESQDQITTLVATVWQKAAADLNPAAIFHRVDADELSGIRTVFTPKRDEVQRKRKEALAIGCLTFGLLRSLFRHSLLTLFLFSNSPLLHLAFPLLRGFFLLSL
jgi:hypothetical protein